MRFWNKSCGLAVFFVLAGYVSLAQNLEVSKFDRPVIKERKVNLPDSLILFSSPQMLFNKFSHVSQPVPSDFSTCKFGFFCKQELVIEKATKIPFRFRLGSLQQSNYYEGK